MPDRRQTNPARLPHFRPAVSRREFLTRAGGRFRQPRPVLHAGAGGDWRTAAIQNRKSAIENRTIAMAPKEPDVSGQGEVGHFPVYVRRAVSQVDTFDPKPDLTNITARRMRHGPAQRGRSQNVRRRQPRAPDAQPLRVPEVRQVGHRSLGSVPACRRSAWTTSALCARSTATATTTRPRCSR